uniref:Uncharacterized protein n=1 Tax=Meloidogyne enterolobii TaxID=390850 RepID=A0A6V7VNP1_MELEN|nr:unnamed protein product [Meloidogyne enterolobii]
MEFADRDAETDLKSGNRSRELGNLTSCQFQFYNEEHNPPT